MGAEVACDGKPLPDEFSLIQTQVSLETVIFQVIHSWSDSKNSKNSFILELQCLPEPV
jgi:hypothetical protein